MGLNSLLGPQIKNGMAWGRRENPWNPSLQLGLGSANSLSLSLSLPSALSSVSLSFSVSRFSPLLFLWAATKMAQYMPRLQKKHTHSTVLNQRTNPSPSLSLPAGEKVEEGEEVLQRRESGRERERVVRIPARIYEGYRSPP